MSVLATYRYGVKAMVQFGDTPLIDAIRAKAITTAELLIEKGADVDHFNRVSMLVCCLTISSTAYIQRITPYIQ